MNLIKSLFTLFTIIAISHAQVYNISGVVKDNSGNGIEGATVILGLADISTKTGSGGSFTLTGNTGIKNFKDHYVANTSC